MCQSPRSAVATDEGSLSLDSLSEVTEMSNPTEWDNREETIKSRRWRVLALIHERKVKINSKAPTHVKQAAIEKIENLLSAAREAYDSCK